MEAVLSDRAESFFSSALDEKVDYFIREKLKVDDVKSQLKKAINGVFTGHEFKPGVKDYLSNLELNTWSDSISAVVNNKLEDINETVEAKISELVLAAIREAA